MSISPRQRFLDYVRDVPGARPVVSPFLPYADVIQGSLERLGLPVSGDPVQDEIVLARSLDYEPMFMTDCTGLIFPWQVDESASDDEWEVSALETRRGTWTRRIARAPGLWGDTSGFPVKTEADHEWIVTVCEEIEKRAATLHDYFRDWRSRVGDDGVIVIGHPHPSWMAYQIAPDNIIMHWHDWPGTYRRSMDAIYRASLFVMEVAMSEGIDFMSDSSYGLEMVSPALIEAMDMPYIRAYADWTHGRGGLFWYHNCGQTRRLILNGTFNRMGADVIETISAPPAGDNNLAESRRALDRRICSKGNLDLGLLRDGAPDEVRAATRRMVEAVAGYRHIFSTADAVLPGTPPANYIAFVTEARRAAGC